MSDEWVETALEDLLVSTIGGVWGSEAGSSDLDVRVYRSTDFNADGRLSIENGVLRSISVGQLSSRRLLKGDILLEKSGGGPKQPVGRVVFVIEDPIQNSVCANFVQLVRPDTSKVDPKFLFYFLWLSHARNVTLEYQAQTTGIRNLRTKDYLQRTLLVPPLPVQRRIVDLMTHLDTHIADLRAEETLARTLLDAARTDEFREVLSAQGERMSNLIKIHHGWAFPSADCRDAEGDGTPRLIRIGDFARSRRSAFQPDRSQEFTGTFPARFVLKDGDLLVVMTCQTSDGAILGWPMRVPDGTAPYLHNQRIGRVEVLDPNRISMDYLTHLFASDPFNTALCRTASGTKVLHTSPSKIEEIQVEFPAMDQQREAAAKLSALNQTIEDIGTEIRALATVRLRLLDAVLSQLIEIPKLYDSLLDGVA